MMGISSGTNIYACTVIHAYYGLRDLRNGTVTLFHMSNRLLQLHCDLLRPNKNTL